MGLSFERSSILQKLLGSYMSCMSSELLESLLFVLHSVAIKIRNVVCVQCSRLQRSIKVNDFLVNDLLRILIIKGVFYKVNNNGIVRNPFVDFVIRLLLVDLRWWHIPFLLQKIVNSITSKLSHFLNLILIKRYSFVISQITDSSRGEILTHIRQLLVNHQCWLNLIDDFNFVEAWIELACVATSPISLLEPCVLSSNLVTNFKMSTKKRTSWKKCLVLKVIF